MQNAINEKVRALSIRTNSPLRNAAKIIRFMLSQIQKQLDKPVQLRQTRTLKQLIVGERRRKQHRNREQQYQKPLRYGKEIRRDFALKKTRRKPARLPLCFQGARQRMF